LQALNNAADGNLRLAQGVKSNEIKWFSSFKHNRNFSLIFMQDSGINLDECLIGMSRKRRDEIGKINLSKTITEK
jgi:hypothetical protein